MKKYIDCLCLCVLLAVCCVACREEEDASAVRSGFLISLVEAPQVGVEARAVVEVDGHSFTTSHLTITNKDNGKKVYDEDFTKEQISASAGRYDIEVSLGEDVVLGLTPYYTGKKEETITEGVKTVSVECSLANALLSVNFGKDTEAAARFGKFFSKYEVKVACGNSSISIGEGEKVYFKAGSSLSLTFKGKLKESGKDYEYIIPTENISVAAKDHTILTLAVAPVEAGVAVEVTKAEVKEETISSTIPMSWLPKPTVSATGFDATTNSLSVVETETASASIDFKLPSALQNMKFKFHFEDPQFASLNEKEYSLIDNKTEIETALGITLPTVGETDASKAQIVLDDLINKLQAIDENTSTVNIVTVAIKTNDRWSDEGGVSNTYTLTCTPPKFTVGVQPGNIWTMEFTADEITVESGDESKLKGEGLQYQYRDAESSEWHTLNDGARQSGLTPGKTYSLRALYGGRIASNVVDVKTYPQIKLQEDGRNGQLDDWYYEITDDAGNEITENISYVYWKKWFPKNAESDVLSIWNTVNQTTTQHGTAPTIGWFPFTGYTPTPPYVGCCYVANSGTIPSDDSCSGKSALIRTVGWGSGSTGGGNSSIIKHVTPGELYIGAYDLSTHTPNYGMDYESRPTGMRFKYKYYPISSDAGVIDKFIAKIVIMDETGTSISEQYPLEDNCGGARDSWSENVEISINYADITKSPKKMYILFKSGTVTDQDNMAKPKIGNLSDGESVGSQLYIDDVELIYDK